MKEGETKYWKNTLFSEHGSVLLHYTNVNNFNLVVH